MATDRSLKAKALANKSKNYVMLAHKYDPDKHVLNPSKKKHVNIYGWHVSEKIDGVRAIYDNGVLYSRNGNKLYAPDEFLACCKTKGKLTLDGELVHLHGFQTTVSIVKDQSEKATWEHWSQIVYVVFDYKTDKCTSYEHRLQKLKEQITLSNNITILEPLTTVKSDKTIPHQLKIIENKGGEGLMIRNPNSFYELGRSWDLLKVKSFIDTEAIVIKHIQGEGKHANRLGKLVCKLDNGIEFEVGTGFTDQEREDPPKIGSTITVKYFDLTDSGKPRFPIYITERNYE